LLKLKGCLVTIDAMSCQRDIAEQIVAHGSDDLLSVKGNQPTLAEIVERGQQVGVDALGGSYASHEASRSGQEITREVWVLPWPDDLFELDAWKGLRSMILAQRTVTEESGQQTVGRRMYISSKRPRQADKLLKAVRQHWSIENQLHWSLDVAFDEDHSRIRAKNSAENMARLRHIALNLLKQEKTAKVGVKIKRGMAGWNNDYLLKVLGL
jgi:predicted transposase YbfD/YdcC